MGDVVLCDVKAVDEEEFKFGEFHNVWSAGFEDVSLESVLALEDAPFGQQGIEVVEKSCIFKEIIHFLNKWCQKSKEIQNFNMNVQKI